MAGRLAIAGMEACGADLSRECFIGALQHSGTLEIDGIKLKFGPNDNQGSENVYLTVIDENGRYRQVDNLGGDPGG